MRQKTNKEMLEEQGVVLQQLTQALTSLAESQKEIVDLLSKKALTPEEVERKREEEVLANCKRVTVFHADDEPKTLVWNGAHRYVLKPGKNEDVPEVFAQMYEEWLAAKEEMVRREERIRQAKDVNTLSRILAETKVPMR